MPIVLNHSILEDIGWAAVDDMASSVGGFRTILPQLQHLLLKRRRQRIGAEERSQCLSSCDLLKKKKQTNKEQKKCYLISLPQNMPTHQIPQLLQFCKYETP